jgi:hypothetical protein
LTDAHHWWLKREILVKIAIVIATLGRPTEVSELMLQLSVQTHPASAIIVSITATQDLPSELPSGVQIVVGSKGLPAQRNRGIEKVPADCDLLAFLDDDYLPSIHALAGMDALFTRFPGVVGANGILLADGINSAGIEYREALALLRKHDTRPPQCEPRVLNYNMFGLYGCNMVYRTSAIQHTRFDEKLPLYAWQEDNDFAAQLLPRGQLVRTDAFAGVHRGVKGARTSGVKFGYSQIVNPLYLTRKGTMPAWYAAKIVSRNLLANHIRVLRPEPWVDRWGRLRGNWLGIRDVLMSRDDPRHILYLPWQEMRNCCCEIGWRNVQTIQSLRAGQKRSNNIFDV